MNKTNFLEVIICPHQRVEQKHGKDEGRHQQINGSGNKR